MKNLVINNRVFNMKKLILIPVLFATTILSGCSTIPNGDNAKYTDNKNNNDYNTETYENIQHTSDNNSNINNNSNNNSNSNSNNDYPMTAIGEGVLTQTNVNFKNSNYAAIKNYLEQLDVYYDYEDLYDFDSALALYNKLQLTNTHKYTLNSITVNNLVNQVKNNNKEYMKKNNTSMYKELSSSQLNEICKLIVETVNTYIKQNSDISIDRIKCVLSDLKILSQESSINNAFVTDDNCLIISPGMLKIANSINGKGTDADVIIHETNHLLQKGCNDDLDNNKELIHNFGFSYKFKSLKINSLDFSWIYEASAEKNMVNLTGHKPLVYPTMIGYLESLSLVNLVKDDYNVKDTEKLSFKRTLNDLYNYFGVTNNKDKREILNMMYSIQIMQQEPDDFYKLLQEKTGKPKNESVRINTNYTIKVSICETLSKFFYLNLSKSIVNKKVTLEDIFYLITLFENDLNAHIKYNDDDKYEYNDKFIDTYIDIQDNFFYQLAKSTGNSQSEIERLFEEYKVQLKISDNVVVNNYSLNFLSKDKKEYLTERENSLKESATISIRDVKHKYNKEKVYN